MILIRSGGKFDSPHQLKVVYIYPIYGRTLWMAKTRIGIDRNVMIYLLDVRMYNLCKYQSCPI